MPSDAGQKRIKNAGRQGRIVRFEIKQEREMALANWIVVTGQSGLTGFNYSLRRLH